jgi:hemoglobin
VLEDFFTRLQADPRTAPFFKNARRERLVEQLTEQLCQESGGPCHYAGTPMGPMHESLEIGHKDFNALVEVLQQSMAARGIPFAAQNGMLARLAPMHREIITAD